MKRSALWMCPAIVLIGLIGARRASGDGSTPTGPHPFDFTLLQPDAPATQPPGGGGSDENLAKQLANPISSLISVPFQFNYDTGFDGPGEDDGDRFTLNVQPVIPFALNDNWNLITRTIVPIIYQDDVLIDSNSTQFGLGDTVQSFFFSPKAPGPAGAIWGVGPVFLWPTATNDSLGSEKWGVGPTGVVLFQQGPWTYGALANHIWSYAGDDDRPHVNATFLQPFLNYTTKTALTIFVNTETTYDWNAEEWTVPINIGANQLLRFGNQPIQIGGGFRWFADTPPGGPDWGIRFNFVLLFPK